MSWQEIITYILIAYAIVFTLYSTIKMVIPQKHNSFHKCSGCHGGCELKDIDFKSLKIK